MTDFNGESEKPPSSALQRGNVFAISQSSEAPSLGKIMRWLQGHDDTGRSRCAYIQLTYMTAETAAEGGSGDIADIWEIDPELEPDDRKARVRTIAEKLWSYANDYMPTTKIRHIWRVIRRNDDDAPAGQMAFFLDPPLGVHSEFGADAPNERGERSAVLRSFNQGSAILFQTQLAYARLQQDLITDTQDRNMQLIDKIFKSIEDRENLLDRSAERQVRTASANLDLQLRKDVYGMLEKAGTALIAKHAPVDSTVIELVESLEYDQLMAISTHLTPAQQQSLGKMLNQLAAKKEAAEKARGESEEKK